MSIKYKLHTPIDADQVEADFRHDLPGLVVTRGLFGSIKIKVMINIIVIMSISRKRVHIFGTAPLLYSLLAGSSSHGYNDDEKRHHAKVYAEWFEIRYRHLIKND